MVGEVAKPHGIKGEVIVSVLSDDPSRFQPGSAFHLEARSESEILTVSSCRQHQGRMIVRFEGIEDRNHAETIRGATLFVEPTMLRPLEDDVFWQKDLEGLEVFDISGRRLGMLAEVLERQDQDLWKVTTSGEDVLVPAVKAIVKNVDLSAGRVVLDPPQGLFEEAE